MFILIKNYICNEDFDRFFSYSIRIRSIYNILNYSDGNNSFSFEIDKEKCQYLLPDTKYSGNFIPDTSHSFDYGC